MATVVMTSSGSRLASGARRRPPLVLRGLRRRKVKKLRDTLLTVMNEDRKEASRGEQHNYTPFLVKGDDGSNFDKAIRLLLARCNNALTQRGA